MQRLNCLVALGGDPRNSVPKFGITVAEAHVLRAIHGSESLVDVEPLAGEARINTNEEIDRLTTAYPGKDGDGRPIVPMLFAGGGAGMPRTVEDLELSDTAFRVISRVTAQTKVTPNEVLDDEDTVEDPKPKNRKKTAAGSTPAPNDGNHDSKPLAAPADAGSNKQGVIEGPGDGPLAKAGKETVPAVPAKDGNDLFDA